MRGNYQKSNAGWMNRFDLFNKYAAEKPELPQFQKKRMWCDHG